MKTLQIRTGFLAISLCFLLACKALPSEKTFTKETYAIINTILDGYMKNNIPCIVIKESSELTIDDFINQLNGQKKLKDEGFNPEQCAMGHIESNIELNKIVSTPKIWDKSKIIYNEVRFINREKLSKNISMKEANELIGKQIFSFSNPIYDKNMDNAVILVDISSEGQILHFLQKEEGCWNIICNYTIIHY